MLVKSLGAFLFIKKLLFLNSCRKIPKNLYDEKLVSCSQAARARYSHNQALLVRLELEDFENEQARACSSSIYGARYPSLAWSMATYTRGFIRGKNKVARLTT